MWILFNIFAVRGCFFCDPYDLRKENCLGNICKHSILDLISCEKHNELSNTICLQIDNYCKTCSIKEICGYGCPRTDIDNKENYFCCTHRILYTHIEEVVNKITGNYKH